MERSKKNSPKKLMVLSLFDGMSCGQLALQRAGIPVEYYFASEIDKYAIAITNKNFPDTVQLGDVSNWIDWHLPKIDLLLGGSPCQGFSYAGKGLNFDDPRSALFFKFVNCLFWYRPTWFLFENVRMKKEYQDIISEQLKVEPIEIDSALVSAQSRRRLYWTNIPNITQPKDKGILLKDILESNPDKQYFMQEQHAGYIKSIDQKAGCLTGGAHSGGNHSDMTLIQLDSLYKNNGDAGRVYSVEGKGRTLKGDAGGGGAKMGLILDNFIVRRLTPLEGERLQTVPEGYTEGVSNTQRYKMLGNGWTVDVIAHILKNIKGNENGTQSIGDTDEGNETGEVDTVSD